MTKHQLQWTKEPVLYAVVHWEDSAMHGDDVFDKDDPSIGTIEGCSVGVVVKDTDSAITLAMDYWETGDFRHCQTISKRAVNKVKYFTTT